MRSAAREALPLRRTANIIMAQLWMRVCINGFHFGGESDLVTG